MPADKGWGRKRDYQGHKQVFGVDQHVYYLDYDSEPMPTFIKLYILILGGTKVSFHLFVWKTIQQLISSNTRINSVLPIHNSKPTFAPPYNNGYSDLLPCFLLF